MSFTIIPALDLMAGRIVLANAANSECRYGKLHSVYGDSDNPVHILAAMLQQNNFKHCYIADLDALHGGNPQLQSMKELQKKFPDIKFWLDSGRHTAVAKTLAGGDKWQQVLGRESMAVNVECDDYVLSLDFTETGEILDNNTTELAISAWPDKVILMELNLVGSSRGTNTKRLQHIAALAGSSRSLYAAGGIRDYHDLRAAAAAGATGALCATALHNGSITAEQIAKLQPA